VNSISPSQPIRTNEQPPNWSHIQATITMLYLSVCQIKSSMKDSGNSVDQLTLSFTELALHSREVDEHVQNLSEVSEIQAFKNEVSNTAREMQEKINQAITAFQFYDRISQRLDHVSQNLESMSDLMANPMDLNDPDAWKLIQDQVKNSYTMESERLMFEHILRGASVKEALDIYQHHFEEEKEALDDDDEVELF